MNEQSNQHTVRAYNVELDQLRHLIRSITKLVRLQIHDAAASLKNEDVEMAREVILRDMEVNKLDLQADEEIIRVIAKRQPMARDLREIMTAGKIVSDLERIGDQARRVARLTIQFYDGDRNPPNQHMLSDIYTMSRYVDEMIEKAIDSFDNRDLDSAGEVVEMGLDLIDQFRSAIRRLSTFIMEDSRSVGYAVDIVLALRALERVGGHSKNIARYMVYMIKGKDVRHETTERLLQEMHTD
ncbi:phosphate signaling complex protein PhoU [Solemya velum gill symbiont]|uniref:Phosphate-specific transport system accessory protein PhoU n=2 Tax=Solemya velum gill symbiont TaxID=2340 RepID=A0A0B0HG32_SOVGS|nr:phosphate signaling complex protein PhoU [Solemya velum gill symbiont]KHF26411.1 phosphate transport system regulatory protein PhoU [Solemya velum gill symbiont]OOY35510.1 phosphate transport system regulatory protein PhoU [Solemya velum gill symbiont]OOY38536.1 phosphate transport system regulatory protein PhoU [Solemya velum gill symbiont]OOY39652.1 phosphate transport system regulatory protein PhoU [Solemya velum gill symbiont]OOY42315.1 phosphate transport system regulatory protein PhoU